MTIQWSKNRFSYNSVCIIPTLDGVIRGSFKNLFLLQVIEEIFSPCFEIEPST